MRSSVHIDNKKKDILILGKGPTQGFDGTATAWKGIPLGIFLVCLLAYSDWIWKDTLERLKMERCIFPYWVQTWEKRDEKNYKYGHSLRSIRQ